MYYVTDFYNILQHMVKLKVIQTFKKLLKPESGNRSDLKNSVYLWLNCLILLSHVFLTQRCDCRLKYIFMCIVFLCSFFYSPFKQKIVHDDIKLCHQIEVFTSEYLNTNNKLHEAFLSFQFTVLTILKLKQINNKSFYCLLIILSGDISLNPGPICKHQLLNMKESDIFKTKSVHLMHLIVYLTLNSLLPKIDELWYMARLSNAAVIGISESKLGKSFTNSEIIIDNYMIYYVMTEIEMEVVLPAISETTWAIHKRIYLLMTLKMFSLKSICLKPSQWLLELFADLRIKLISLKLSLNILWNLIKPIKKLTFLVISTYIYSIMVHILYVKITP